MQTGYLVVTRDGLEYGPLDRDTIQRWYKEGRLDQNSRVYEPGGKKALLKEVFDLTVWNNPALISEAVAKASAQPDFTPKTNIIAVPRERTPGMLVAALLLMALGLVEVLAIAATLVDQEYTPRGALFEYVISAIADLVLAIGLFRGNQKFRGWGLARAVLGAVFILLTFLTSSAIFFQWVPACFQFLMCAGIATLLAGESPSKLRVWAGAAAVLVAWSGLITWDFVFSFTRDQDPIVASEESSPFEIVDSRNRPGRRRSELDGYRLPVGAFEDDTLGVSFRLPNGWTLLAPNNPVVVMPEATVIAAHEQSGSFATFVVEAKDRKTPSLDAHLGKLLIKRTRTEPSTKQLGIEELQFGGQRARRARSTWISSGHEFRGFLTVCEAGSSYYALTVWTREENWPDAFLAFESLENAFQISGTRPLATGTTRTK